jgi:hypothetical protein
MSFTLVLVAALCGGCGTLDNIKRPTFAPPNKPDAKVVRIYGGVRGDWGIMTDYNWSRTVSYADYVFIPLLASGDLVFDVVGDTVTLPYTAVAEIRRATRRPNAPAAPAVPEPLPPGAPPTTTSRPGSGPAPTPLPNPRPLGPDR